MFVRWLMAISLRVEKFFGGLPGAGEPFARFARLLLKSALAVVSGWLNACGWFNARPCQKRSEPISHERPRRRVSLAREFRQ